MRKTNTTLDREPLSSETIRERQNFNYVLKGNAATRIPLWKSAWFYGPVGLAMVTLVVSAVRMNPKNDQYDNITTLAQTDITSTFQSTKSSTISSNDKLVAKESKSESMIVKPTVESSKQQMSDVAIVKTTQKMGEENTELKPEVLTEQKIEVTQVKSQPVKTNVESKNTMPDIAGVFTGRVSVREICAAGMINCNNGYEVISYDIQYDNGAGMTVDRVSGNKIPGYICTSLQRYNVGSPIFITKIIAQNSRGERKQLLSMSIEPTF